MLAIQIGDEFLELPPSSAMELVEENPFLQFAADQEIGNYSLPFEFQNIQPNVRLTQYAAIIQKIIDNTGIEARLYSNGLQESIGKIKIEKPNHNLNNIAAGKTSCYYLYGASSFFLDIKDKKLRDINLGGQRSFAWDDYATTGPGFWGHIHDVLNATPASYDYAFYPVINKEWAGYKTNAEIMNRVHYTGGQVQFSTHTKEGFSLSRDANVIVPFPYLKTVLLAAVAHVGWSIEGAILEDPDFVKTTLINFQSVHWANYRRLTNSVLPLEEIVFDLCDHLPDVTIAQFIVALKNRMGWWYDYDFNSKRIRISKLKDVAATAVKDMTPYASPLIPKKVAQEKKVYALRNEFSTNLGDGQPSFASVSVQEPVNEVADLPTPSDDNYGHVHLVIAENNYYVCSLNDYDELVWEFYSYNIYDFEPKDANEEVTTAATTVGVEKFDDYLDLIPRIDNSGNWFGRTDIESSWGTILCFYHGLRNNKAGQPYPYASSHIYDSNFNQVTEWALTFECKKIDGTDVGLYNTAWKPLLNMLSSPEEFEVTLNLPLHMAKQLKFSDQIVIAGVKMFVKQKKRVLEYNGSVQLEAVRVV